MAEKVLCILLFRGRKSLTNEIFDNNNEIIIDFNIPNIPHINADKGLKDKLRICMI